MKGVVTLALKRMVVEKFGPAKWKEVLVKAEIDREPIILATSDVDDPIVLKIFDSVCRVLNMSRSQGVDAFGDYWINVYSQKLYHSYYVNCKTAKDFLLEINEVHMAVTRNIPNAHPPKFEYEWKNEKTLIMKYKSKRGLVDLMVGFIRGVGKFYGESLKVTKLGDDKVEIIFQ